MVLSIGTMTEKQTTENESSLIKLIESMPVLLNAMDSDGNFIFWNKECERVTGYRVDEIINNPNALNILYPDKTYREQLLSEWAERGDDFRDWEMNLTCKDGTIKTISWSNISKKVSIKGWASWSIGVDVTERKQRAELTRIQHNLGIALADETDYEKALEISLRAAIDAAGMDCGGIYIVDENTGALELVFHEGLPTKFVDAAGRFDADSPQTVKVMEGNPMYSSHKELGFPIEKRKEENLRAIAIVPVKHEGRVIGCLNIASHEIEVFPHFSRTAVETITGQIGLSIARIRGREKLKAEHKQLLAIFDSVNEIIYVADSNTYEILYVNMHCKKVFARDPVGEKCYNVLQGFNKPCDPCVNELLMEDFEKPHYREYYNPTLKRHFMAHDRMIKWPDGRNVHFELAVDITDRKRFEEELTKERDFAENLVATANVIILVLDVKGKILLLNPYMENISGYKIDEVKGKDWFATFLPERDIEKIEGVFDKTIMGEGIRENVNPIVTKGGRELMIEWNSTTLKDVEGSIIGVLNVGEDITERLKVEGEIKKHQEQLEELVKERTKQLEETQAELVIKERLAVLGQLVAVVSHEIRNPLGTIASSIFTIKERVKDANVDLQLPVERIKRSVSRCDRIIEELLYYTRKRDIELKSEHIDKWIDDILLESEIPPETQLIRKSGCDFEIEMDSEKIRRCLVNLIDNAVQAIDEKNKNLAPPDKTKAAITVETCVSDGRLEISVEDTGSGISEDNLKIIFEPLYSTKNFGVGLGLSIIKQIIEQHGGGIKLESKLGIGTKATLWLPVND